MATVGQKIAVQSGRSRYSTVPIGQVAYGSVGTNTTPVAGTIYWAELNIPREITLTGAAILNGDTVGTDKALLALYDTNGALVANTATAGTTTSGTDAFQPLAFTATVKVQPGRYFLACQFNGTTTRFRTIATLTNIDSLTASATGTFGTLTALTVPTTITADKGPVGYVYA